MLVGLYRFEIARHAFAANTANPSRMEWMREIKPLCVPLRPTLIVGGEVRPFSVFHNVGPN